VEKLILDAAHESEAFHIFSNAMDILAVKAL
jgi:hypothetical protein